MLWLPGASTVAVNNGRRAEAPAERVNVPDSGGTRFSSAAQLPIWGAFRQTIFFNMPIDAHEKPPEVLRASFKKHQKLPLAAVESDPNIVDFKRGLLPHQQNAFTSSQFANENLLRSTLESFLKTGNDLKISLERAQPCFHARDLPGAL